MIIVVSVIVAIILRRCIKRDYFNLMETTLTIVFFFCHFFTNRHRKISCKTDVDVKCSSIPNTFQNVQRKKTKQEVNDAITTKYMNYYTSTALLQQI